MSPVLRPPHLVRRFLGSFGRGGPDPAAERWVREVLNDGERRLWRRMSPPDRRHAVAVARRVEHHLGSEATPAVLAAALLHDVGKVEARLGTWGRVVATVAAAAGVGVGGRIGAYLRHAELGAQLLEGAGSDPLTVAWAREHHAAPEAWSLPTRVARALKAADDD